MLMLVADPTRSSATNRILEKSWTSTLPGIDTPPKGVRKASAVGITRLPTLPGSLHRKAKSEVDIRFAATPGVRNF